jgi:hypothetical protein
VKNETKKKKPGFLERSDFSFTVTISLVIVKRMKRLLFSREEEYHAS